MKLRILLSSLLFTAFALIKSDCSSAQINLVPNPGFDTIITCPYPYLNFEFPEGNIVLAAPWFTAKLTTEYPTFMNLFDTCGVTYLKAPWPTGNRYQQPRSGSAFVGGWGYWAPNAGYKRRDFAEVELYDSLIAGRQYFCRFYVNNSPDTNDYNYVLIGDVGMALSSERDHAYDLDSLFLDLKPSIEHKGGIFTDTAGWTPVAGAYNAKGGERYIIIGNFKTNASTQTLLINPGWEFPSLLFYEDVGVYEYNPLPDTLFLCSGASHTFSCKFLEGTNLWSTGSTDTSIVINKPGLYTVTTTIDGVALRDTVYVMSPADVPTEYNAEICEGGMPITLSAPYSAVSYQWSNGSKAQSIQVSQSGELSLQIQTGDCGIYTYQYYIRAANCQCDIMVPTGFTPNGDGRNDVFRPSLSCDYAIRGFQFQVFNRWGSKVFTSLQYPTEGWDGRHEGIDAPIGTYVWMLKYEIQVKGQWVTRQQTGDITLIR